METQAPETHAPIQVGIEQLKTMRDAVGLVHFHLTEHLLTNFSLKETDLLKVAVAMFAGTCADMERRINELEAKDAPIEAVQ